MLQNVTPKKLLEPKLDYDVINAKLIKNTIATPQQPHGIETMTTAFFIIRLLL